MDSILVEPLSFKTRALNTEIIGFAAFFENQKYRIYAVNLVFFENEKYRIYAVNPVFSEKEKYRVYGVNPVISENE